MEALLVDQSTKRADRPQDDASPDDKRGALMAAALREFAERGYERASTNAITEAAGVSKGILFHYFGSKAKLYLAVLRHSLEHAMQWGRSQREAERPSADFIERLVEDGLRKLRYTAEHPLESRLVIEAFTAPPAQIAAEVQALGQQMWPAAVSRWREGLDETRFRNGVDVDKAVELVALFLEGLRSRYSNVTSVDATVFARVVEETRQYFDLLKYGIYEGGKEDLGSA